MRNAARFMVLIKGPVAKFRHFWIAAKGAFLYR